MKLLLIAGFSNQEIRDSLHLRKNNRFLPYVLKLLNIPRSAGEYHDYASWVTNIISYFEQKEEYELHVLVHHFGMKRRRQDFKIRGIHYHFFPSEYSSVLRKVKDYKIWRLFQNCGRHTKQILREIKPDLVLLSGAENPVTSVSILYAKDYPRLCLCQVVYNDPERAKYSRMNKLISSLEKAIFKEIDCFAVYCRKHFDLLRTIAPGKFIFKFNWPPKGKLLEPSNLHKEYDFVNFAANHAFTKGTHDSIRALSIVKQSFPSVTLNIVGGCREELLIELSGLIKDLHLEDNVVFTPFFEKKEDLLFHVQKSRFAVLPCKLDNVSGTMIQSMLLGLPIVVYQTMGTLAFNAKRPSALIANMNDVDDLAKQMVALLERPSLAETLRVNGRLYKEEQVSRDAVSWERLVESFPYIIDYFKFGIEIPQDRLFSPGIDD